MLSSTEISAAVQPGPGLGTLAALLGALSLGGAELCPSRTGSWVTSSRRDSALPGGWQQGD